MENLLNRLQIVQECDARKDNSSTTDAPLNKKAQFKSTKTKSLPQAGSFHSHKGKYI